MKYECKVCGFIYDEEIEGIAFENLDDAYVCPLCNASKEEFEKTE